MDNGTMSPEQTNEGQKRKRTSLACDPCRYRKVRCDGRRPCTTCSQVGTDCIYGSEAVNKSKSDMILDVAIRSETLLQELSAQLSQVRSMRKRSPSHGGSVKSPQTGISPSITSEINRAGERVDHISNATLSPFHASTTESILAWPQFAEFGNLIRGKSVPVFRLEQSRAPLLPRPSTVLPFVSKQEVVRIVQSFERGVNFWYPTMACGLIEDLRARVIVANFDDGHLRSCLSLLVMALGCACELVGSLSFSQPPLPDQIDNQNHWRQLADSYFDCGFKKVQAAHTEFSAEAALCLFFTGLYFSYQQRPLQAWSFISAAATKCRLLLSYEIPTEDPNQMECLRRIFWSCYILESDFLAELAGLPQTGIADIESSIPLPGNYPTQESKIDQEQSSLYFLACISMRRLLNRVHDLLYARDVGVGFDNNQFPSVVSELAFQLDEWKDLLPFPFQFTIDLEPTRTEEGAFLRQRYLTCKSVIYRPYLTWALSNGDAIEGCPPVVLEGSRLCLQSCWMHAQNLRSLRHTIMVDTWICSLSMASVILITLAASRVRALHPLIAPEVVDIGPHLSKWLTHWSRIPGASISPSISQSIDLIDNVSKLLQFTFRDERNEKQMGR
ncbi:Fungal Zn(2)-Cys(6) binuclear cluster domain-containing protein [Penicillium ucsense]|uniref:Fungal Zn(2)-Cys(6) binuclear cluster domain-containing protein n=1 Tax=Penicillium ucsense TaxID=2839758 RepID=A0A8J8W7W7_9EURO|nr:Fungal Zn(2)-Cys(6) binuclear cluster domain-containing protein [Penicillium ucsense]KAF7735654.1 Fungal Zn(2)-Cys(6) binuclear cluster domain-containing protein [Penicillium ucsense]